MEMAYWDVFEGSPMRWFYNIGLRPAALAPIRALTNSHTHRAAKRCPIFLPECRLVSPINHGCSAHT